MASTGGDVSSISSCDSSRLGSTPTNGGTDSILCAAQFSGGGTVLLHGQRPQRLSLRPEGRGVHGEVPAADEVKQARLEPEGAVQHRSSE